MEKIYNKKTKNLEFYKEKADDLFWDAHWGKNDFGMSRVICHSDPLVKNFLEKYSIPKNSTILEAGCGRAHRVYFMDYSGFKNTYGIDYAKKTVQKINSYFPHLKVTSQDVRQTTFSNNFFDVYFSFGVIEHFYDGFDGIIKEAIRIVKPEGYLIFYFPVMSSLRKLKAKLNLYSKNGTNKNNFYQYALNLKHTIKQFESYNLSLIEIKKYDGMKGLKDEVAFLQPILQKLYSYRGKNVYIYKLESGLDKIFRTFAAHMAMLIFKKDE